MFLGEQKVEKIEGTKVTLENWSVRELSENAQKWMISEVSIAPTDLQMKVEKQMVNDVFEALKAHSIDNSFDSDSQVSEKNQVEIAASIIKLMEEKDYPVERIWAVFADLKAFLNSLESLVNNNIKRIDDDMLVKALKLDSEGSTNGERIRNVRMSHYVNFFKSLDS